MPGNAHDSSSREIFSSPHGSFSSLHDTASALSDATVAPGAGSFMSPQPGAAPGVVGQRFTPASVAAVQRPATAGVGQDKGALDSAPQGSSEPAPGTKDERRFDASGTPVQPARASDGLKRSERLTLRVRPGVKSTLQRLAKADKISLSKASANGLEDFARAKIHDQEEVLFAPRMQAMMRRVIRASDDRLVPFALRTAMAAEQTRLISADLYKRQLLKEGVSLPQIQAKLKGMYHQARANILKKTPQLTSLLDAWWQEAEEEEATTPADAGAGGGEEGER